MPQSQNGRQLVRLGIWCGLDTYLYLNLRLSLRYAPPPHQKTKSNMPNHIQELSCKHCRDSLACQRQAPQPLGARKHRYLTHRSRWALEMAARATRSRRGSRNGCSSPLGAAVALEMAARACLGAAGALEISHSSLLRCRWGARNRRSSPLGLDLAARSGRSKWPLGGFAGAFELAARARSASLGRSEWPRELARLRWGERNRCSSLLGLAGAL
jgi:hypothetical protein